MTIIQNGFTQIVRVQRLFKLRIARPTYILTKTIIFLYHLMFTNNIYLKWYNLKVIRLLRLKFNHIVFFSFVKSLITVKI